MNKKILLYVLLFSILPIAFFGQSDATSKWDPLDIEFGTLTVTNQSHKVDNQIRYDYRQFVFNTLKQPNFFSVYITTSAFQTAARVVVNGKSLPDKIFGNNKSTKFVVKVNPNDTVNVIFFSSVFPVSCNYQAQLADTTTPIFKNISLDNLDAILSNARSNFKQFYSQEEIENDNAIKKFPNGVLTNSYADIDRDMFTQFIKGGLSSAEADKIIQEWEPKISKQLKKYNLTSKKFLNKEQLLAKNHYLFETAHEYIKLNENNQPLFRIYLGKEMNLEGSYNVSIMIQKGF